MQVSVTLDAINEITRARRNFTHKTYTAFKPAKTSLDSMGGSPLSSVMVSVAAVNPTSEAKVKIESTKK